MLRQNFFTKEIRRLLNGGPSSRCALRRGKQWLAEP
jgi:hypothetical protein